MAPKIHGFVDGEYLRHAALDHGLTDYPNPRWLLDTAVTCAPVKAWARQETHISRVTFYDAIPSDEPTPGADTEARRVREQYWQAVELLDDTQLGFGKTRRRRRRQVQKGVDTLIAVDMLVGAFTGIYDLALLVAGDADFVPAVEEVRRRGATVIVVADRHTLAEDLLRAADRYVPMAPDGTARVGPASGTWSHGCLTPLKLDGTTLPIGGDRATPQSKPANS